MSVRSRTPGRREGRGARAFAAFPLLALVLAVCGCSAAGQEIDLDAPSAAATAEPGSDGGSRPAGRPGLGESTPDWVDVPDIGAHSSLVPLGLNEDRTIAVPSVHEPMQAGWYRYGPTPGERGPAVILGHVNGDGEDGIFARLHELRAGDEIRVGRNDGAVARFRVTHMAQVPKDGFPSDEVYGDTSGPELRLITCGGAFDEAAGSYRDNIIAFATFTGTVGPAR